MILRLFYIIFISLFFIGHNNDLFAQKNKICGTANYKTLSIQSDSSLLKSFLYVDSVINNSEEKINSKSIKRIPIVVHVIWSLNSNNISESQIESQIKVFNEDFRRKNSDAINTPAVFKNLAADCEIEFCLAKIDPQGNNTNGITRKYSNKAVFSLELDDAKYDSKGGVNAWDTKRYLNIWIVPALVDGQYQIAGYSQMPGGNESTDGVVIAHSFFGTNGSVHSPYHKGRTAVHEIGHWLGLVHIWGDDSGECWGSDNVGDTPNQANYNIGCPTHPSPSCDNKGDMFMNYMDYSDDDCMNMFTEGQKKRMQAVLDNIRTEVFNNINCGLYNYIQQEKINVKVFPNPATEELVISSEKEFDVIEIYNISGELVFSEESSRKNTSNLNLSSLSRGIYILKIIGANYCLHKKIIKK